MFMNNALTDAVVFGHTLMTAPLPVSLAKLSMCRPSNGTLGAEHFCRVVTHWLCGRRYTNSAYPNGEHLALYVLTISV